MFDNSNLWNQRLNRKRKHKQRLKSLTITSLKKWWLALQKWIDPTPSQ